MAQDETKKFAFAKQPLNKEENKETKIFFVYGSLRPDLCCWDGIYDVRGLGISYGKARLPHAKLYTDEEMWPCLDYHPTLYSSDDFVDGYWLRCMDKSQEPFLESSFDEIEEFPFEYQKKTVRILKMGDDFNHCFLTLLKRGFEKQDVPFHDYTLNNNAGKDKASQQLQEGSNNSTSLITVDECEATLYFKQLEVLKGMKQLPMSDCKEYLIDVLHKNEINYYNKVRNI